MNSSKVLRRVLAAVAVIFLLHQLYSSVYKPITTETARYFSTNDGLDVTGVIIRSEQILESTSAGVYHYVCADGERVAKNGLIAGIYDSQSASLIVSEISAVQKRIEDIEELSRYNDLEAADLDLLNSRVRTQLNVFVRSCASGIYSGAGDSAESLLHFINRRQVVTGEVTDFSAQLFALNARLSELNASLPAQIGSLVAPESGFFISSVDGYETVLTCENLESITPEFLKEMTPAETPSSAVGKIVSDYEWYIAAAVSVNDSLKYKKGDRLKVTTSLKESPELSVEVAAINLSEEGDTAVILLSCSDMNSALATARMGPMRIISREYEGLKVSKSALRVLDGKTGVYTVSGAELKFVEVNVLYSDDSYMICEQTRSEEDVLRLYDEVVVRGKNLYDGKIVR